MKWLYFITTLVLFTVLARAESSDGVKSTSSDVSPPLESKTHRKRELFGNFGKYSHGYDIARFKHSYIKPLMVHYPVQSFPIGVKIPFKNPHQKQPFNHNFNHHGSSSNAPHFHIQNPIHLPKPAWPTNNCHHDIPRPLPPPSPPTTPIVPVSAGNAVPAFHVPIRPALVPPVFDAQPFTPIAAPSVPIAPIHFPPPIAPVAPVAPLLPLKPIVAAPVVPVIKHGLSTHSFSFATFPRHHYVNTLPALVHAPAHVLPAPVAHAAPVAPLLHRIPIHQYPIPAAPVQIPFGRVPVGPVPLGFAQHQHLFNQIPVNFPVAHNAPSPLPAQTPLGVSPFPQQHVPAQTPLGVSPFPQQHVPAGQNPFFFQMSPGHDASGQPTPAQIPHDESGFSQQPVSPQNPFLPQGPSSQFPRTSFLPESGGGSSVSPGFQEQGNSFGNSFPSSPSGQPAVSNVWMPMTNQNPEQFPSFQYPQQDQFPSQINPEGDTSQVQPQGEGNGQGNEEGYRYQQNGNQAFQDGQNIQQNLQQQAEQQFLQAQQYFNQQGQPSQEQNVQGQQEFQQQQQQYSSPQHQQQQEIDDNVQQFSQQQFISGPQLASSDPQHDPQLPQALPDHHLSGRPINQAYVRINHRRRLRKRPHQNQEE